jgi:uncharacterized protein
VAERFDVKLSGTGTSYVRRAPERKGGLTNMVVIAIIGILIFGNMLFRKKPVARGVFTGMGFSGVSLAMGIPVGLVIGVFGLGLVLGLVGIGNFLTAIALSRGGGRHGGGWGGGGGGFSGGGSSGSW